MIYTDKIPRELKRINQWVCWKRGEPKPNGKVDKIPVIPSTGKLASVDKPETWTTFDEAIKNAHYYDGIGLVLTDDLGMVGTDIDDCLDSDTLKPEAAEIVHTLGSYTEITPSDEGIRIFAYGSLPPTGRKSGKSEMYQSGRFLTVTGKAFNGTPLTVNRRADEILQVHKKIFGDKPEQAAAPPVVQPVSLGDMELLTIIGNSKNGADFERLWTGDTSAHNGDHSAADLALCNHLAFYTGNDSQRIDRLFRQSGLMRDKWDKEHSSSGATYGMMTIEKAISDTTEAYTPPINISIANLIHNESVTPELDKIMSWADLRSIVGPIEWDWSGWIAKGFQTLVASVPGEGKSNLILHIARCYLSKAIWPDLTPFTGNPGKVLWVETESAQVLNLERAEKWKLPIEHIITPLDSPLDNVSLDDEKHCKAVLQKAMLPDVRLIVVDSLSGGTRKESKSSSEMMIVGSFLADLAKFTGKPVIVSHHLNKNRNGSDLVTLDRVRDSSAIVQLARIVWAIDTPDTEKPEAKRLYCIKNNLAKFPAPLGFEINDTGLRFTEVPQQPKRQEKQLDRACGIIEKILTEHGKVSQAEIIEAMNEARISSDTMYRAKEKLGVFSHKIGDKWYWSFPQKEVL